MRLIFLAILFIALGAGFLVFMRPSSVYVNPRLPVVPTPEPSPTPTPTPLPVVTFNLVGDLGLGRHITSTARSKSNFNWSFESIAPTLESAAFTVANLESPIINDCPHGPTGTFTFCGDTRFLPYLAKYRFIFNLANNHILNYARSGFDQTVNFLSQNNISSVYSHDPNLSYITWDKDGISFGMVGYDFITYPNLDPSQIVELVTQKNPTVDWLIVSLHWGNEYLPQAETWRQKLARQLVDAGADIIHGHHPHVWQEPETYQGKPIFYSLGNFVFDQSWSYETSHSKLVQMTVTKSEIKSIDYLPYEIYANSQPRLIPQSTQ